MRSPLSRTVEASRITKGVMASEPGSGPEGAFAIRVRSGEVMKVIAGDGRDWAELNLPKPVWEHVSVSTFDGKRLPTWEEMDEIRHCFWLPDEVPIQLHVGGARRVNTNPHVLHMWRPIGVDLPMPPKECV